MKCGRSRTMLQHIDLALQELIAKAKAQGQSHLRRSQHAICPMKSKAPTASTPCSPRSTASESNSSTAPTPIAASWPSRNDHGRRRPRLRSQRRHAARIERSDSHVPVANGEHPAADAGRRNPPGEEDRAHPQALPPQLAAVVLRSRSDGEDAGARPQGRAAVRSHDQGVAHRAAHQGAGAGPHAAQPAAAAALDGSSSSRISRC